MSEESFLSFHWEILSGLPGVGSVLQFHLGKQQTFREGLVLQVGDAERSWIGNFQNGGLAYTNVIPFPAANTILVIAGGMGYKIPVGNPQKYEVLDVHPITYSHFSITKQQLIVATFTDLFAYGPSGLLWSTGRLVIDDLEIATINDDYLIGKGWRPNLGGQFQFKLWLDTGHYEVM